MTRRGITRAATVAAAITASAIGAATAQATSWGAPEPVGSGLVLAWAAAGDSAGNVFVTVDTQFDGGSVVEIKPDGTQVTVASGFEWPAGIALDSTGDLFVTDYLAGTVVKIAPDGDQTTIASGLSLPNGIAVDSAGDVFVTEVGPGAVVKIAPNGSQTTVGSGFHAPWGVAVNPQGDVFVADSDNNRIVEVAPDGTQTTVGSGFSGPRGVTVDPAGDVIVADTGNARLVSIAPNGTQTAIPDSWLENWVSADPLGDLLVSDNSQVKELPIQHVTQTTVSCGPTAPAETAQTCTAMVRDTITPSATPTGTIEFSSDGAGRFVPHVHSCTLTAGSCSVDYKPSAFGTGSQTITAVYGAAETEAASTGQGTLTISPSPSHTGLSCQHPTASQIARLKKGGSITVSCTTKVTPPGNLTKPPQPSGSVDLSVSPSGAVMSPMSCTLPAVAPDSCTSELTISAPGSWTVTGTYTGDQRYQQSSAQATVKAG